MKTTIIRSGHKAFKINVQQFVTLTRFSKALTEHVYRSGNEVDPESFFATLTKTKAKDVLRDELFWYGQDGEYTAGFFEASPEPADTMNQIEEHSHKWITENYPELL